MSVKSCVLSAVSAMLALFVCSCSIFQDMGREHHENHATMEVFELPVEKLPDAIQKGTLKAGYSVKRTLESPVEGEYQADSLDITYKKIDDKKCKIYVRVGCLGEKDKETLIINEIKKELGLK